MTINPNIQTFKIQEFT